MTPARPLRPALLALLAALLLPLGALGHAPTTGLLGTPAHNHGDDSGFWNVVEGFATKTGYRAVFVWDADAPVAANVRWGWTPSALTNVARPLGNVVDAAGIAIVDLPRADVAAGRTVHFQVVDLLGGTTSPARSFPLANAWTSDASDGAYEIDALLQIDTPATPAFPNVPSEMNLLDAAAGVDVLAERVWDMTDGYVRMGTVVVTDTILNYPAIQPFGPGACLDPTPNVAGSAAGHTLADFVVETTVPFDSHTWGFDPPPIDHPCTGFYVGRLGQLVTLWSGDLHLGAVLAHEFGHYAFGLDDLYGGALFSDPGCWVAAHDISVMSNAFGFRGGRWQGSELDRLATPCNRLGGAVSWGLLRQSYPLIPALGRNGDGLPDHTDSCPNVPRGNPDGGAFRVFMLDHEPGGVSRLVRYAGAPQICF